jgi:acetyl esterase/lipase
MISRQSVPYTPMSKFDEFHRTDLVYSTVGTHELRASVLRPKCPGSTDALIPVMVFWHGGGFITGSRMYEPWWPKWLIQLAQSQGAMIVAPDFRLMPEASPSDVMDDVASFWMWYSRRFPGISAAEAWDTRPDLGRTICAGQSSGAVIGIHSALEHQDVQIKAILALYGPICFELPLLNMPMPRIIGGSKPLAPRQAEAMIRSYITRNKGKIRTSGNPNDDWELVTTVVQQGWLARTAKRNADSRLDVVAHLKAKLVLPPIWVVQGRDDSIVSYPAGAVVKWGWAYQA